MADTAPLAKEGLLKNSMIQKGVLKDCLVYASLKPNEASIDKKNIANRS